MKVEYDKKEKEIKYMPENDMDIFRAGRVVEVMKDKGYWRFEFVSHKLVFVAFKPIDLFNMILDYAHPQPKQNMSIGE